MLSGGGTDLLLCFNIKLASSTTVLRKCNVVSLRFTCFLMNNIYKSTHVISLLSIELPITVTCKKELMRDATIDFNFRAKNACMKAKSSPTEEVGSSSNASDFYSLSELFECRPEHRLS
jgi:hypothetical protein